MTTEIKEKLSALFEVNPSDVDVERVGPELRATVDLYSLDHDSNAKPFTLKQMMALPAILGTEHIDFGHDAGSRGSESGSWGHYDKLVITARIEEDR